MSNPPNPNLRILVVDDELAIRDVITSYLAAEGHEVTTANDGLHAFDIFTRSSWDLVITDRSMPRMRGDELAARVKSLHPEVPVIMLTGSLGVHEGDPDIPHVDRVLRKPFHFAKLSAAISAVSLPG